jgi:RNA polymerase sigma factor (sigma-70 family)
MPTNQCLINQAKAGDPHALAEIYGQYRDSLMTLAVRYCRDTHVAEDVLQDVFVSLMVQFPKLTLRTSLYAYLKTSVFNQVRSQWRKEKARHRHTVSANDSGADQSDPEKQAILKEQVTHLQRRLKSLPPDQRDVLMWRVYEGHSFDRISQFQAIGCGTVRARYRYGRTKLALLCAHVM